MAFPNVVLNFSSSKCSSQLLIKANLLQRKVVLDGLCEECGEENETSRHVLLSCSRAREMWESTKFVFTNNTLSCRSLQDFMWHILMVEQWDEDKVAKLVIHAWALWHNRNETRNGGVRKPGKVLSNWAQQYSESYMAATALEEAREKSPKADAKWTKPPENIYKINVDGATITAQGLAGVGAIIRDRDGRVEAALSKKMNMPLGALEVEAKALKVGLVFAKDVGVHDIILEGDCLTLCNALNGLSSAPASVSAVIVGIQDLCKEFRRVEFSRVRREGNKPTHLLAKHVLGIVDFSARIEEIFCYIEQALIHDVATL